MEINQYIAEELAAELEKMGDAPNDILLEVFEWAQNRSWGGVHYWLNDVHDKDTRRKALIALLIYQLGEQLALNKWRQEKAQEIASGPKHIPGGLFDRYAENDE